MDDVARILAYHERTKHHAQRYARGPGWMDWSTQPDPFRTFEGAPGLDLPLEMPLPATSYDDLHQPGAVTPIEPSLDSISTLFLLSLGLSAWKEFGGEGWALRCNPSSGNLHPTEGYLVTPGLTGLPAGVHHYVSRDHRLEHRAALPPETAEALARALPPAAFLVGLTSIHWREAWKYGERAFRYCQHDVGHALAALRYAAATLGWSAELVESPGTAGLAALLGVDRAADFPESSGPQREEADALLLLRARPASSDSIAAPAAAMPDALVEAGRLIASTASWQGFANLLSPNHVDWEAIDVAAAASTRPAGPETPAPARSAAWPPLLPLAAFPAATLIRQRRSAVAMDGVTPLPAATFFGLLDRLLPRPGVPPWDVLAWAPHLHCALFVHRVEGLEPGLYFLERDPAAHDDLRRDLDRRFVWTRPAGSPEHLPLYLLAAGDQRGTASGVSCNQDLAGDGAFSLGMLAFFGEPIRARGAWWWRRLFWESGLLGQTLYLGAEAAGFRGCGLGCYFDDLVHQVLGLSGDRWQSLYHFAVGGPIDDRRLATKPPYAHLAGRTPGGR